MVNVSWHGDTGSKATCRAQSLPAGRQMSARAAKSCHITQTWANKSVGKGDSVDPLMLPQSQLTRGPSVDSPHQKLMLLTLTGVCQAGGGQDTSLYESWELALDNLTSPPHPTSLRSCHFQPLHLCEWGHITFLPSASVSPLDTAGKDTDTL